MSKERNTGYKSFIEDNLSIVSKSNQVVPFILNKIQNKYLLEDYTGKDVILKARQQGFSSLILALFTTDFLLKDNTRSVIVADITDNAIELLDRVKFYIKSYEDKNQVQVPLKYNSKYELFNEAKNSRYTIGTADNAEFGRSKTITNLHLSEFNFYKDPERLFAGAMQAVIPDGRVIIESTANGFNFGKTFWDECVTGERPFKPNFYKASDFYDQEFLKTKEKELGRFYKQEYPETPNEAFLQATGLVYQDFDATVHVKELEFQPEFWIRGLDIGFRNPTALPIIGVNKEDVWYQKYELYETELTTPRLGEEIKLLNGRVSVQNYDLSTADSAQAGDIVELNQMGFDFIPVKKESGESTIDYVRWKIQKFSERIRAGKYFVHPRCVNTIREFQSYRWKEKPRTHSIDINEPEQPEKANDHMMDALADLNAMYMHFYEEKEKKPWDDKVPGTYIPPYEEEVERTEGFTQDRPDDYWND